MKETIKEQLENQKAIIMEPEQKLNNIKNELSKVLREAKTIQKEIEEFPSAEKLKKLSELESARKYLNDRISKEEASYNELKREPSRVIKSIANSFIKNEVENSEVLAAKKKELDEGMRRLRQIANEYSELQIKVTGEAIEEVNDCGIESYIDHTIGRPYPDTYSLLSYQFSMDFLNALDSEMGKRGV